MAKDVFDTLDESPNSDVFDQASGSQDNGDVFDQASSLMGQPQTKTPASNGLNFNNYDEAFKAAQDLPHGTPFTIGGTTEAAIDTNPRTGLRTIRIQPGADTSGVEVPNVSDVQNVQNKTNGLLPSPEEAASLVKSVTPPISLPTSIHDVFSALQPEPLKPDATVLDMATHPLSTLETAGRKVKDVATAALGTTAGQEGAQSHVIGKLIAAPMEMSLGLPPGFLTTVENAIGKSVISPQGQALVKGALTSLPFTPSDFQQWLAAEAPGIIAPEVLSGFQALKEFAATKPVDYIFSHKDLGDFFTGRPGATLTPEAQNFLKGVMEKDPNILIDALKSGKGYQEMARIPRGVPVEGFVPPANPQESGVPGRPETFNPPVPQGISPIEATTLPPATAQPPAEPQPPSPQAIVEPSSQGINDVESFKQAWAKANPNLTPEQVEATGALANARAQTWSQMTGRPVNDYFKTRFSDIRGVAKPVSSGVPDKTNPSQDLFPELNQGQPKAAAQFIGYQDMGDPAIPPVPIYNITGEHPANGSTVSAETLQKEGIPVPVTPSFDEYKTFEKSLGDAGLSRSEAMKLIREKWQNPELYQQKKGSVSFDQDQKAIITAFEKSDVSTVIHELGHVFRRDLYRTATEALPQFQEQLEMDQATVEKWAGVQGGNWTRDAEEKWARGFEHYMTTGEAPNKALQKQYDMFSDWMRQVYGTIAGSAINVKVTPAVRDVFDRMFTSNPEREARQQLQQEDSEPNTSFDFGNTMKQLQENPIFQEAGGEGKSFAKPAQKQSRKVNPEMLDALLSPEDKFKDLGLGQSGELSTLAPIRATEVMDGKRFGLMKKNFLQPIQDADKAFQIELKTKREEADKAFRGISDKDKRIIFDLIENKVTSRDPKILGTAAYLRQEYDNLLDRINAVRESIGKDPIQKRENYITHYQELNVMQDVLKMIGVNMTEVPNSMLTISMFTKPNSPYFQFAKRRLTELTERNAEQAFRRYLEPALRTIHFSPATKQGRDILEYKVEIPSEYEGGKIDKVSLFGLRYPNAYKYFTNYLNTVNGKRPILDKLFPGPAAIFGVTSKLFAAGSIGGNISTVVTQLASFRNTVAETGLFALQGQLLINRPKWYRFFKSNSRIGLGRQYEPSTKGTRLIGSKILAKTHETVSDILSIPVGAFDREMVGGAFLSGYFKGKALGLNQEEAIRYGDDVAERTQASANMVDRPPVNTGKIKTALGQFQTFIYNEWAQIKNDIAKKALFGEHTYQGYGEGLGGIKEGRGVAYKRFAGFLISTVILSALYDSLGIPNPFKQESMTVPGGNDAVNYVFQHMINQVPFVGNVRFGGPPIIQILKGTVDIFGSEKGRKQAIARLGRLGIRLIPGGGQISKTLGAHEYAFKVPKATAWELAKGYVFGKKYMQPRKTDTKIKPSRQIHSHSVTTRHVRLRAA